MSNNAKIIEFDSLRPPGGSFKFEGVHYDVSTSFFVVNAPTGRGADKHRHPYPEVFVLLEGEIEMKVDDETQTVGAGHIVVIPADTWHEFKAVPETNAKMVNIHPTAAMVQENWNERQ